ncbi:MAG: replicative DNA helicase [bacterium]|nr:replicative DNA helicase [bacterium]MDZ4285580.1 replicative DNA helicase [Candidatus Sungbacteria bacterium]
MATRRRIEEHDLPPGTRMPPQNNEAEMSVLGSLMLDKDAIYSIVDALSGKDFYKPLHKEIYDAMLDLYNGREPIDVLSVTNRLRDRKSLETIGGSSYVTSLVNTVPTASNVAHYATIVRKKRLLRDLIDASHYIAQLGYRESEEVEGLIDEAEQRIFGIARDSLKQDFFPISTELGPAFERIERVHKPDHQLRGVRTGFNDIDDILSGLQPSDLIILAARPSLGKTSLALNIARNVAVDEKKAVGVFSLEMSRDQLVDRLIASEAEVDSWKLRTGRLESNDFIDVRNAMSRLSGAQIFIDDASSPTTMELRAKARRLQAEYDLGLIVIDYLQLIKGPGWSDNRVQEVSEISRNLKGMAKELNVPVLALSQLSRGIEMRGPAAKPKLSDLRESGSIEQDADVVMFIYREDKVKEDSEKKNIATIMIEKHRNGRTGYADLFFKEESTKFRSMDKHLQNPAPAEWSL